MTAKMQALNSAVTNDPEMQTVSFTLGAPGVDVTFTMSNDDAKEHLAAVVMSIARNEGMGER